MHVLVILYRKKWQILAKDWMWGTRKLTPWLQAYMSGQSEMLLADSKGSQLTVGEPHENTECTIRDIGGEPNEPSRDSSRREWPITLSKAAEKVKGFYKAGLEALRLGWLGGHHHHPRWSALSGTQAWRGSREEADARKSDTVSTQHTPGVWRWTARQTSDASWKGSFVELSLGRLGLPARPSHVAPWVILGQSLSISLTYLTRLLGGG